MDCSYLPTHHWQFLLATLEFSSLHLSVSNLLERMVPCEGLEPPRLSAPDPKSGVSANFTSRAENSNLHTQEVGRRVYQSAANLSANATNHHLLTRESYSQILTYQNQSCPDVRDPKSGVSANFTSRALLVNYFASAMSFL
jgi:hypothetical protein